MSVLTTDQTIRLGFAKLRRLTDPRGHSLLDVLEQYMIELQHGSDDIRSLTLPLSHFATDPKSNVVPLDRYSRRV